MRTLNAFRLLNVICLPALSKFFRIFIGSEYATLSDQLVQCSHPSVKDVRAVDKLQRGTPQHYDLFPVL